MIVQKIKTTPKKIGVFDSGAGGLSVLKSLINSQSFEEIIYYGDTARVPYGNRSQKVIIQYSLEALIFFKTQHIDLLIVACNTISAYGLQSMQQASSYPIIGVIKPGILALENTIKNKDSKILILGTKATIKSNLYQTLLQKRGYHNLAALATSLFVPLVEEGIFEGEILDSTMHYYFKSYPNNPDAIILGCTHFPLIAKSIAKYFDNKPLLIHSGDSIMQYLQKQYPLKPTTNPTKITFFASDNLERLKQTAKLWLNQP